MTAIALSHYQETCKPDDLTIVTVSFRTARMLRKNLALARALNPHTRFWWIVVENSGDAEEREELEAAEDFVIVSGPTLTPEERKSVHYGSFHHAKALNIGFAYAVTNRVLALDPDCFIVLPEWIDRVSVLMDQEKYIFWGTPYHPERLNSFNVFGRTFMYFPTAICMFVDRARLQAQHHFEIDFSPPVHGEATSLEYWTRLQELLNGRSNGQKVGRLSAWCELIRDHGIKGVLNALQLKSPKWTPDRRIDIGHRLYALYHRQCRYGHTSVYYPRRLPPLFGLWKSLIPQAICGFPKKRGHWRKVAFSKAAKDLAGQGRWEQFYMGEKPFALHIGKVTYAGEEVDINVITSLIPTMIERSLDAA